MTKKELTMDLMEVVSRAVEPPNCDKTLDIQVQHAAEGTAKTKWVVDERFLNGVGIVMGGFVSSAADITMAYAIASLLKQNQTFASINLNTTFHRPATTGTVEVEAVVEKFGKKVAYLVAEVKQNDKVVASVVSSVMILER